MDIGTQEYEVTVTLNAIFRLREANASDHLDFQCIFLFF